MTDKKINPILDEDQAESRLREYGILPTHQRLQIARLLFSGDQHLSADRVLEILDATGQRVSKATVYNTLGLFARKNLLREVSIDPSRVFYDTNNSAHHHFYNIDTGELSDISPGEMPVAQLPAAPAGTVIDGVEVVIRLRREQRK